MWNRKGALFGGVLLWLVVVLLSRGAFSQGITPEVDKVLDEKIKLLQKLFLDPAFVKTCRESTARHADMGLLDIQKLDKTWIDSKKTITPDQKALMTNPAALKLQEFQDTHKGYAEIFVTDAAGMNIAMTNKTSDLWQADEAWWQKAYAGECHLSCPGGKSVKIEEVKDRSLNTPAGADWLKSGCKLECKGGKGAVHKGKLQYDESAQKEAIDVSVPVLDPVTRKVLGVAKALIDITQIKREIK